MVPSSLRPISLSTDSTALDLTVSSAVGEAGREIDTGSAIVRVGFQIFFNQNGSVGLGLDTSRESTRKIWDHRGRRRGIYIETKSVARADCHLVSRGVGDITSFEAGPRVEPTKLSFRSIRQGLRGSCLAPCSRPSSSKITMNVDIPASMLARFRERKLGKIPAMV